jgi:2-polyprenyl-3-methyl-5-hydroxy-6-metoxy-1,4-benzoquinol methylase
LLNKKPYELIAADYLKMIRDYREGGIYFKKHNKYPCPNQEFANNNVYSNKSIMDYYMNALLISQIFWKHHFEMFIFFDQLLDKYDLCKGNILEVGPGHGFFSYLIQSKANKIESHSLLDISSTSLEMSRSVLKNVRNFEDLDFIESDIFDYSPNINYDFIVLGEVLEHLDNPLLILEKLNYMLKSDGYIWITTPTNSPAIDHVYWFKNRAEVLNLMKEANFEIIESSSFLADNVDERYADEHMLTNLIGVFAKKIN